MVKPGLYRAQGCFNDQCNLLKRHFLKKLQLDDEALLWLQILERTAHFVVSLLTEKLAFRTLRRRETSPGFSPFL
jgi:hypothetical protein